MHEQTESELKPLFDKMNSEYGRERKDEEQLFEATEGREEKREPKLKRRDER
jgi:hypothetical protein